MLLIFVIETTESNDSDKMYISKYLKTRFAEQVTSSKIVVQWVYLNGKANYKKGSIENKIKELESRYLVYHPNSNDIHIIYCIDIDAVDLTKDNVKLNNDIKEYCLKRDYHLIWFNKTIEHVFLGKQIHQAKHKKAEARSFFARTLSMDECCDTKYHLKQLNEVRTQTSNIGFILKKIFDQF